MPMLVNDTTTLTVSILLVGSCFFQLVNLLARLTLHHSLNTAFIFAMLLRKNVKERLLLLSCWFTAYKGGQDQYCGFR